MAVYRFEGDIGEDHRLTIPREVPAGRAQIVVIPEENGAACWPALRQLIHELSEGPGHTRSKEEIDARLRHERESWG